MKKSVILPKFLIILIFLSGSCNNKKDTLLLNVIPVAETVGRYSMLNLSDFTTEIKYIPLETNDSVLLSDITDIAYENNKLLVRVRALPSNFYLFENTGKFCCKIGQFGQGPDDYLSINSVSIFEDFIYLMDRNKMLIYNTRGNLIENNKFRPNVEYINQGWIKVIPLKKDTFVMNVISMTGSCPKAFLLEMHQSDLRVIKEYENYELFDKVIQGLSTYETGLLYRFNDEVRTYKIYNDTIFSIGQNMEMKDVFMFELGKYRPTQSYLAGKEGATDPLEWMKYGEKFIFPKTIVESLNYLFISFNFGNHTPEPVEVKSPRGTPSTNTSVCGVFNKVTGVLTLMSQPIKGKFGFTNDVDGGPVIWPMYISSNNELVTYIQPEEFMEYYNKIKNPSVALKEIADKIDIYDNPIVIIAKLKD